MHALCRVCEWTLCSDSISFFACFIVFIWDIISSFDSVSEPSEGIRIAASYDRHALWSACRDCMSSLLICGSYNSISSPTKYPHDWKDDDWAAWSHPFEFFTTILHILDLFVRTILPMSTQSLSLFSSDASAQSTNSPSVDAVATCNTTEVGTTKFHLKPFEFSFWISAGSWTIGRMRSLTSFLDDPPYSIFDQTLLKSCCIFHISTHFPSRNVWLGKQKPVFPVNVASEFALVAIAFLCANKSDSRYNWPLFIKRDRSLSSTSTSRPLAFTFSLDIPAIPLVCKIARRCASSHFLLASSIKRSRICSIVMTREATLFPFSFPDLEVRVRDFLNFLPVTPPIPFAPTCGWQQAALKRWRLSER